MQNWRTPARLLKRHAGRIVRRIRNFRYKFWITPRSQITEADIALLSDDSRPVFFHCPHGLPEHGMTTTVKKNFESVCDFVLTNNVTANTLASANNLVFVTYSNYPHPTLFEKSCRKLGIQPIVLGKPNVKWTWLYKVSWVRELMDELPPEVEYLALADATDVLIVNDPALIIERFNQFDCDLLFCNTVADWPPSPELFQFEASCYPDSPYHSHLSAGAFIARRSALTPYLDQILDAAKTREDWTEVNGIFEDQACWRYLHREHYPKIKVDHLSSVFCRFDIHREQR